MIRDVIHDLNNAVGQRWQALDPLLPAPADLPEGCLPPFLAGGLDGRPAGLGVCHHRHEPTDSLAQTWGAATKFVLTMRLRDPQTEADELLAQWREHLAGLPEAAGPDTAAIVNWPARDVTGVLALLRHGLQPMAVIAARPASRPVPSYGARGAYGGHREHEGPGDAPGLTVRLAGPDDLDDVAEMEMGVIAYDARFGGSIPRPATAALVQAETRAALTRPWAWIAERDGRPVGLIHVEPPESSRWIAGMTRPGTTAYLQTMYLRPRDRGAGIGAALVSQVHHVLDTRGIDVTLLHYGQVNPLSAPFWHRMGYRPLWTIWEARPAAALR
jgi:GNAT superfamily N-acetyltransferase